MRQFIFFAAPRYPISLLHTTLIACIKFSMSYDFKPDLLRILLADILKKQCIKFINRDLLLVLQTENHSAELQSVIYVDIFGFSKRLRLYFIPNQASTCFLKLLNLLKVLNFEQHLRFLKRKTN